MRSVVTLIAAPDKEKLTRSLVEDVAATLQTDTIAWLKDEVACDLFLETATPDVTRAALDALLESHAIDTILQPISGRKKHLLISDMDSTIITIECIDELADYVGLKPQVAAITERAMRGELDFPSALRERVALLAGMKEATLEEAYRARVRMTQGAKELVATMRSNGAYTLLVSGGFTFFTQRVADALRFHAQSANQLEIKDGVLTGRVIEPILDKHAKLEALQRTCAEKSIAKEAALAVGDGANDLPMLQAAGLGVAYHAKPVVEQNTQANIRHTDLTSLLYAQGYKASEILHSVA